MEMTHDEVELWFVMDDDGPVCWSESKETAIAMLALRGGSLARGVLYQCTVEETEEEDDGKDER